MKVVMEKKRMLILNKKKIKTAGMNQRVIIVKMNMDRNLVN